MEIAVTIAVVLLLGAVMLLVARAGGSRHQETLNQHQGTEGVGARDEERGRPAQPHADRPAGPDAEAMGVRDAGATSVDPTGEQPRS